MSRQQRKRQIRLQIGSERSSLPPTEHARKSQLICAKAIQSCVRPMLEQRNGLAVFTYIPFRGELDTMPLVRYCWEHGIAVYAPRTDRDNLSFDLYRIESENDLEAGAWGIREPRTTLPCLPEEEWPGIDIVVVPGIAFAPGCGRVGYGGGYYDRFISTLRRLQGNAERNDKSTSLLLALAFDLQVIDEVPMEEHDFYIDRLITETKMYDRNFHGRESPK
ncbi:5-formyltetrahydrofolate cyclo-ligase [Paenibacillus sp. MSJ-34]|uniref:5-formyltetrahydrofolate cyclo-ligase n=1 Tax=Paenibacillus sp. MSJ-34 TaxID=2841529 RepID=UPI001C102169|nr:5-formyltetrahydrofolate cyclo-ligase [Paenibacillus sp. MSJ-34]MBU5443440.1 5-formyltetrahydrofolate cyclo-ligase [Paenibacillus sp. MSJ-34]